MTRLFAPSCFRPYGWASALLGAALLIGFAGVVKAEPVIVIIGQPVDQPSLCVANPNLCLAGGRPVYGNPPPTLPADVIPPGASVSANDVNADVIKKVQAMTCSQLRNEADQKKNEINNLNKATQRLKDSAAALTPRVNQTSSDYAYAQGRYGDQKNVVVSARSDVRQACDFPKKKLDAGDMPDTSCAYENTILTDALQELASREKAQTAAQQAYFAAAGALSAVQTGLAYASARAEADGNILEFIASVARSKQCAAN